MDSNKFCRLCIAVSSNENFENISDVTMQSLDILLLKLDLDKSKHVMCKVCVLKVKDALKFKSMCICTNNTIIAYVNETGCYIDLLEIYAKEKGTDQLIDTYNHKVCRLCMQLINGKFMSIQEIETDVIEIYIPEINLDIIEDPVVCKQCFDALGSYSSFIKKCLEVDEKIKGLCNGNGFHSASMMSASVSCVKAEDGEDIKLEEEHMKSKCPVEILKMENLYEVETEMENSVVKQEENKNYEECTENKFTVETSSEDQYMVKPEYIDIKVEEHSESDTLHSSSLTYETQMRKCLHCDLETVSKSELENHIITLHRNISLDPHIVSKGKVHRCDKCNFVTKYRNCLKMHQLKHKDPSQLQMYKCEKCSFESRYMICVKRHQLIHADPSQTQMYNCDKCDYETKHRENMKNHQVKHTNPSKEEMYQCDKCSFVTKYRMSFKGHQLIHKDPSQVRMYECDKCDFKSKRKGTIKTHESRHINPSGQEMYPCEKCSYVSACRLNLEIHQLRHKDPSQVQMYKCDECSFESRYRSSLRKHQLKHLQVQTYKCDKCDYETKHEENMENHQLKHTNPSEEEMYQCDKCSYASKHLNYLKQHLLKHEAQIFKCDKCSFETVRRGSLTRHQLVHQEMMYKCYTCNFETKHKGSLKKHQSLHRNPQKEEKL